jgi:hypothetical protein
MFLQAPSLQYRRNNLSSFQSQQPNDASWNLSAGWKFNAGGDAGNLNIFNLRGTLEIGQNREPVQNRSTTIQTNLRDRFNYHGVRSTRGRIGAGEFQDLDTFWSNTATMSLESTLVALPNLNQINYALIRRLSDLQHGVQAVCAHTPKINWYSRANPSKDQPVGFQTQHLDNIAMNFNSKVMGTNHKLQRSDIQRLLGPENQHANTIVFGADVGHPGSGSNGRYPKRRMRSRQLKCRMSELSRVHASTGWWARSTYFPALLMYLLTVAGNPRHGTYGPRTIGSMGSNAGNQPSTANSPRRLPTSILFYRDGISESYVFPLQVPHQHHTDFACHH